MHNPQYLEWRHKVHCMLDNVLLINVSGNAFTKCFCQLRLLNQFHAQFNDLILILKLASILLKDAKIEQLSKTPYQPLNINPSTFLHTFLK